MYKPYALADRTIQVLQKYAIKRFEKHKANIRLAKFDELNVIEEASLLYTELDKATRKAFRELFIAVYTNAVTEDESEDTVDELAEICITEILDNPHRLTHMTYSAEILRKRDYMSEAVNSVTSKADKQAEMDKALRLWSQMIGWYTDFIEISAHTQALMKSGVKRVRWNAQEDEKVCRECEELDGEEFDIGSIPDIPLHLNCRCYLTAV